MKQTFEQHVIETLVSEDEYIEQMLSAWKAKLQGVNIDLNKVSDNLHDAATMKEGRAYPREESELAMYGDDDTSWESA